MNKAWFVAKGIARLTVVVLLCLVLAALGYMLIVACVLRFPPHAIQ